MHQNWTLIMESNMNNFDPKDIIMWRFSEDREYQKKIIDNLEFAQKEFSRAGITIDKEAHQKLKTALKMLEDSTSSIFGTKVRNNVTMIAAPQE
jgi:hypothetical protein